MSLLVRIINALLQVNRAQRGRRAGEFERMGCCDGSGGSVRQELAERMLSEEKADG